jgi:hypothetical protein
LKSQLESLYESFKEKWVQTMARNLDKSVFGKDCLFNKCMIFDPFMKSSLNQNFECYSEFFNIISDKKSEIKRQFSEYLLMDAPNNTDLDVMEYWK